MTTDRDRALTRQRLQELLARLGAKPGELSSSVVLLVTRTADFDIRTNDLWELDENKSYPRAGLKCSWCSEPVVMSNRAFADYTAMTKRCAVCCMSCFQGAIIKGLTTS